MVRASSTPEIAGSYSRIVKGKISVWTMQEVDLLIILSRLSNL